MMRAAGGRIYYGFDLFEDGSRELDKIEFNAKPRQTLEAVSSRLRGKIHFRLFKGNSKETLPLFLEEFGENSVDFAYIDGGHSVETIQSDWDHVKKAVKPGGLVIFDDYYVDRDVSEVGCNQIVEKLSHEILPIADPVVGGGKVQLVLVRNDKCSPTVVYKGSSARAKIIADAMADGIKVCGDNVEVAYTHLYPNGPTGDIAVFYGYEKVEDEIFNQYIDAGKKVLFVDVGYFSRKEGGRYFGHHRIAINARHPSETVMKINCPPDRLDLLRNSEEGQRDHVLNLEPWHTGEYILLAGMKMKSCLSYGLSYGEWEIEAIRKIREQTDMPIIYRPKPKDENAKPIEGTVYSDKDQELFPLLRGAHAVVTHHSNVAIEALVLGTPCFVFDGISKPLSSTDISTILNPYKPDDNIRKQWLQNVAYWQWTVPEIRAGLPWRWLKLNGLI